MKRGTPTHPKTYEFAEALGVSRVTAIGHLELLFHFAAQYAPAGDVGKFSDRRIAAAVDWRGRPERLIEALVRSGFVDEHPEFRLVIHDWHEHADDVVRKKLSRAKKSFVSDQQVTGKMTGQSRTACPEVSATVDETVRHSGGHNEPPSPARYADHVRLPMPMPMPMPMPINATADAVAVEAAATTAAATAPESQPDEPPEPDRQEIAAELVQDLLKAHPVPGNEPYARAAAEREIADAVDPVTWAKAVREAHSRWLSYWSRARPHYIPPLQRWIRDRDYLHPPSEAQISGSSQTTRKSVKQILAEI